MSSNLDAHFLFTLQVTWVIGVSMVLLAVLIHLPPRALAISSIAMIALHNLLDNIKELVKNMMKRVILSRAI